MIVALLLLLSVCGCGGTVAGRSPAPTGVPTAMGTPLASPMAGGVVRSTQTAWHVVRTLSQAGFAATNPLDTTAHECPAVGCRQSVVTDQLRVKSFATPSEASRFALAGGLDHVGTVVVAFAPPLSPSERARYWTEIENVVRGAP
jgi:hypothetical protein